MLDGYYWVFNPGDSTYFIALLENGSWYCCGVRESIEIDVGNVCRHLGEYRPNDAN